MDRGSRDAQESASLCRRVVQQEQHQAAVGGTQARKNRLEGREEFEVAEPGPNWDLANELQRFGMRKPPGGPDQGRQPRRDYPLTERSE